MIKYYSWAIAQKVLSYVPGGDKVYYGLGSIVQKNVKGRDWAHVICNKFS